MADFPTSALDPNVTITPWAYGSIGLKISSGSGAALTSTVFPAANRAIFVPFYVMTARIITQLFWANGTTVSGNVDCGVYTADGTRLFSTGSTGQAGSTLIQAVDITDTPLGPGLFHMALAMDNVTGTLLAVAIGSVARCSLTGIAQMETAFVLPATVTPATIGSDYIPLFGLTTRSVV